MKETTHALFQLTLKCDYASLPASSLERSLERRSEDFASIKDKSVLRPRAFWPFHGGDSSKCVCHGFRGAMSAEEVPCVFVLHVCTLCMMSPVSPHLRHRLCAWNCASNIYVHIYLCM